MPCPPLCRKSLAWSLLKSPHPSLCEGELSSQLLSLQLESLVLLLQFTHYPLIPMHLQPLVHIALTHPASHQTSLTALPIVPQCGATHAAHSLVADSIALPLRGASSLAPLLVAHEDLLPGPRWPPTTPSASRPSLESPAAPPPSRSVVVAPPRVPPRSRRHFSPTLRSSPSLPQQSGCSRRPHALLRAQPVPLSRRDSGTG